MWAENIPLPLADFGDYGCGDGRAVPSTRTLEDTHYEADCPSDLQDVRVHPTTTTRGKEGRMKKETFIQTQNNESL